MPVAVVVAGLLVVRSLGTGASRTSEGAITVAAAADLQFAFSEIGRAFEQETGYQVVLTFGSSGTLAQQIDNGARVDVFASADTRFVDDLVARGRILADSRQVYALGQIALVSHRQTGLSLRHLGDLARPEVKRVAIANPEHAPYGMAARQALEAAGVWEQVRPKLVYGENVRQALQYVETGNAEAGIVALSIANVPEVDTVPVDESLYQPLRQSMGVVAGTTQEQSSRRFVTFVNGPAGRAIMRKYGFQLPGE